MNGFREKENYSYTLNLQEKRLTLPKSELKNISQIVSKIKELTCLSYFEISELEFKITE